MKEREKRSKVFTLRLPKEYRDYVMAVKGAIEQKSKRPVALSWIFLELIRLGAPVLEEEHFIKTHIKANIKKGFKEAV